MEPLKEDLLEHNLSVLTKLPHKATIGIDTKTGKLRPLTTFIQKLLNRIKAIFNKNRPVIEASKQAINFLKEKKVTEATKHSEFQQLIQNIANVGIFKEEFIHEQMLALYNMEYDELIKSGKPAPVAEAIVTINMSNDTRLSKAFRKKIAPTPTSGGISGSYFIRDRTGEKIVGIFKPRDEEVNMPNNPKGYAYDPEKDGVDKERRQAFGQDPGESWAKEIAAYLIDKGQFAGVPFTTGITVQFPKNRNNPTLIEKEGSFQVFKPDTMTVNRMTTDQINNLSVEQVQKVAIFDILVGNGDRNFGNLLWHKETNTLIPIDHGISLLYSLVKADTPEKLRSETRCHWLPWPQIEEAVNQKVRNWIDSLQINDAELLKYISNESILELKMRLNFLKLMLMTGYNIKEIALMAMDVNKEGLAEKYKKIPRVLEEAAKTIFENSKLDRTKHQGIIYLFWNILQRAQLPKPIGGS